MTKDELVNAIASRSHQSKKDTSLFLTTLGEVVSDELTLGNDIALQGVGKFSVALRDATSARNPRTGEPVSVPARRAVKFRVAAILKDRVAPVI